MAKSQPRSKSVAGAQCRHVIPAHVPGGGNEGCEQASGENSTRLQGVDAEDLAFVRGVVTPLVDDVKKLRAQYSAKNEENAEIPGLVAVVAEAFGVADAYPETEQNTKRDKESVGREEETSDMKELWEHLTIRCGNLGFAT